MQGLKISSGTQVKLHFALLLEDGVAVDSTFDKDPATLIIGDGSLPSGFEELILGMGAGEEHSFTVPPEKAFGQHNPSNVQTVARTNFTDTNTLEVGMIMGFADKAGNEVPGVIAHIDSNKVEVDFNHPLAGRTLVFKVAILEVSPVSVQ